MTTALKMTLVTQKAIRKWLLSLLNTHNNEFLKLQME